MESSSAAMTSIANPARMDWMAENIEDNLAETKEPNAVPIKGIKPINP